MCIIMDGKKFRWRFSRASRSNGEKSDRSIESGREIEESGSGRE